MGVYVLEWPFPVWEFRHAKFSSVMGLPVVGQLNHHCLAGWMGKRWLLNHLGLEETHITSIDLFLWSELSHGSTWVQYNMQSGWIATSQGQLYTMGGTECILMDCLLYLLYFMTKFSCSMHSHRQAVLMRFTVIIIHNNNLKDIMVDQLVIGCVQLQTMSQFQVCSNVSSLIWDV